MGRCGKFTPLKNRPRAFATSLCKMRATPGEHFQSGGALRALGLALRQGAHAKLEHLDTAFLQGVLTQDCREA